MRTKVQEKKEKMSTDEQQQQQQQQQQSQQHQQQQQNQIPNIAGTILIGGLGGPIDFDVEQQKQSLAQQQNPHHPHHQYYLPHLHQFCTMTGSSNPSSLTHGGGGANGGHKGANSSKSSLLGPSPFWQLLPVMLCVISFATVLSVLVIYMDTNEIRHQQFRLNMSRDYDLMGVPQDNPALIKYVRDIHMKKYPMTFMRNSAAPTEELNFNNRHELTPEMAHLISDLLGRKRFGTFFQSLAGNSDSMMTAPWLAETMNWGGTLVEPDPRKYFSLRKQNAFRPNIQVVHACLSPNTYPKEVTLHHDDDSEVQINSVLDEETEWFHPRVKCFPVYTLMLAVNRTSIDLLSLGCHGQELQILQTIPFDRVHIKIITIHLVHFYEEDEMLIDIGDYVQSINRFLMSKSYKLVRSFERNFIYQHSSVASAAKRRLQQQQQQQQQVLGGSSVGGSVPILPRQQQPPQQQQQQQSVLVHTNAINSGEKLDVSMAIHKGQEASGNGNAGTVKPPMAIAAAAQTTSLPAAPVTVSASDYKNPQSVENNSNLNDKLVLLRGSETDEPLDAETLDGDFVSDEDEQVLRKKAVARIWTEELPSRGRDDGTAEINFGTRSGASQPPTVTTL
ncbi:protein Star-like isoform X2 [Anopheles albimanus]|nr:protein Star-like isoform X2 [Anopheles albimanus]